MTTWAVLVGLIVIVAAIVSCAGISQGIARGGK